MQRRTAVTGSGNQEPDAAGVVLEITVSERSTWPAPGQSVGALDFSYVRQIRNAREPGGTGVGARAEAPAGNQCALQPDPAPHQAGMLI